MPVNINTISPRSTVLVLGATGFIGGALAKRLRQDGLGVRALVRGTSGRAQSLARLGVELAQGDVTDTPSVAAALDGVHHVVHLARSACVTWSDCVHVDVEPTRRLAELCCTRGIALYYTSSIAIYDGGRADDVIAESTPACQHAARINPYARPRWPSSACFSRCTVNRV